MLSLLSVRIVVSHACVVRMLRYAMSRALCNAIRRSIRLPLLLLRSVASRRIASSIRIAHEMRHSKSSRVAHILISLVEAIRIRSITSHHIAMSSPASELEKTILIVKPSAYAQREAIIAILQSHDFFILQRRDTTLTRAQAVRLYTQHYGMRFYDGLIASMIAGPLCVLILQRRSAIAELRHLVGPTDPAMAKQVDVNCLRALYGKSALENGVHASKNATEAAREEDALFQRLKRTIILFGAPASGKLSEKTPA